MGTASRSESQRMMVFDGTLVIFSVLAAVAGCAPARLGGITLDRIPVRDRALECLEAAVKYKHNPVVRVEAVEALESYGCEQALPWIRTALSDEHPAVRFAACAALGRLSDGLSENALRTLLTDKDASVQVAAVFALHRIGHIEWTGRMPTYLLQSQDVTVRRNAVLLLGLLGEPSAVKILARAMRDADPGVRHHALEAMARLGNSDAKQELVFMSNAGVGSEEVFAIAALAQTEDAVYLDTFRYKLATATHPETRLAAARALGRRGSQEGFDTAMRALGMTTPPHNDPNDPPADQVLRIRQMAAAALGAIGKVEALSALSKTMNSDSDPRVQVSAARAILEILAADQARALPFVSSSKPDRS